MRFEGVQMGSNWMGSNWMGLNWIGSNWIGWMMNISNSLIDKSGPPLNAYFPLTRHAIVLQLHTIKSIKVELANAGNHIALACLVQEIYIFENPDNEFIQSNLLN